MKRIDNNTLTLAFVLLSLPLLIQPQAQWDLFRLSVLSSVIVVLVCLGGFHNLIPEHDMAPLFHSYLKPRTRNATRRTFSFTGEHGKIEVSFTGTGDSFIRLPSGATYPLETCTREQHAFVARAVCDSVEYKVHTVRVFLTDDVPCKYMWVIKATDETTKKEVMYLKNDAVFYTDTCKEVAH